MYVLGIESSCDDTSAAVLDDGKRILSNVISSQNVIHGPYGGVVPELASRAHVRNIMPVVSDALEKAGISVGDIDLVASTIGPGLVGSLLVGLNYAKALSFALGVPFIGVNHIEGHFFSAFLEHNEIEFPLIALVVSGGHTGLWYSEDEENIENLTSTRDDAAGEAFDKVAKMLGLSYPGGPVIDRLASMYEGEGIYFALPKISDGSLDFSFSGLKTAVLYYIKETSINPCGSVLNVPENILSLLKGFQSAVVEQLLHRVKYFCQLKTPASLVVGGGVGCNSFLRARLKEFSDESGIPVYFPSPLFSTDNAAMIAYVGYKRFVKGVQHPLNINANNSLMLGMN